MSMNEKQKKLIVVGVAIIILMGLFPPWKYTFNYKTAFSEEPAGYGFLLSPPKKKEESVTHGIELDMTRLCVQWIIVSLAAGLGVFLASTKE